MNKLLDKQSNCLWFGKPWLSQANQHQVIGHMVDTNARTFIQFTSIPTRNTWLFFIRTDSISNISSKHVMVWLEIYVIWANNTAIVELKIVPGSVSFPTFISSPLLSARRMGPGPDMEGINRSSVSNHRKWLSTLYMRYSDVEIRCQNWKYITNIVPDNLVSNH